VASTLHPEYRKVLKTYLSGHSAEIIELPAPNGRVSLKAVNATLNNDVACLVIQSPNVYGLIEDWDSCFAAAHEQGKVTTIAVFNPIVCGLLKKPGECGADVAVGEGQPLGVPLSLGGHYLGLLAAGEKFSVQDRCSRMLLCGTGPLQPSLVQAVVRYALVAGR